LDLFENFNFQSVKHHIPVPIHITVLLFALLMNPILNFADVITVPHSSTNSCFQVSCMNPILNFADGWEQIYCCCFPAAALLMLPAALLMLLLLLC
jgi:hypothetical protein